MCAIFGEKFFSTQEKVSLVDLGRDYQTKIGCLGLHSTL
ncbi:hypothetical protein Goshw_027496 [Gossypium schwendimanii]|uniref:Uncharacterized protein n=1 Tax=Gossypium schwendimanii TaxID=34291 RepID=A0A7J9ME27_GOSSC|nr:hypothetical protein [Gossypium schwendimanii]